MKQHDLFGAETAPYVPGSETSKAAADEIRDDLHKLQKLVLDAIRASKDNGLTDQQIQTLLNMGPATECPRRIELREKGLIKDSGTKRLTRSGRKATVWVAT